MFKNLCLISFITTFLCGTCYESHAANESVNKMESTPSAVQEASEPSSPWFVKDRWFLTVDFGTHYKPFLPHSAEFIQSKDPKHATVFVNEKDKKYFWGEVGVLASYGIAYKRVFENKKWFWGSRIVWTWFYPDVRYNGKDAILTLAGIPYIGQFFTATLKGAPTWIEMLVVPMLYFDFGYITDTNISFSIGSVYLWGLSPTVSFPISDNFSMEMRQVLFLDKVFKGGAVGIHAYMMSLGINYSLK